MLNRKNFLFYSTIYFDEFACYVNSFKNEWGFYDTEALANGIIEAKDALRDNDFNTKNELAKRLLDIAKKLNESKSKGGKKGMESRWGKTKPIPIPECVGEVYDFGQSHKIPDDVCKRFFDANEHNHWTLNGERMKNWKGALVKFYEKEQNNNQQ